MDGIACVTGLQIWQQLSATRISGRSIPRILHLSMYCSSTSRISVGDWLWQNRWFGVVISSAEVIIKDQIRSVPKREFCSIHWWHLISHLSSTWLLSCSCRWQPPFPQTWKYYRVIMRHLGHFRVRFNFFAIRGIHLHWPVRVLQYKEDSCSRVFFTNSR